MSMVSKGSKKRNRSAQAHLRRKPKYPLLLFLVAFAGFATAAGIWLHGKFGTHPEPQPSTQFSPSSREPAAAASKFDPLKGRWLRPDGGYVIEIHHSAADGSLQADYYNPRPILVSEARAMVRSGKITVFIELRDVGYPGAKYSLTYDPKDDVLAGLYYQPAAAQTFEVIFIRQK